MIEGNLKGLKAAHRKSLDKLEGYRIRDDVAVTPEFAHRMAMISSQTNRAVGVLIDRRGRVQSVIVGDSQRLYLPDIGRQRGGGSRFRGLRLIRTVLGGKAVLIGDDLTDLSKLQLDLVAAIKVEDNGQASAVAWAHLVPDNPERKVWNQEIVGHVNHFDFEFSHFIAELESEFERGQSVTVDVGGDRAMLIYVRTRGDRDFEARIAELHELCSTAGVEVVETYTQTRPSLDPKYATGKGALEEIELRCLQLGADMLIYGQDLAPNQVSRIGAVTSLRVIDRTQLILDIFAQRAMSRSGKLQVELAQLKYQLPRLRGRGTEMSRLAGGIGGRGPGESKLELDRRRVRDKVHQLDQQIEKLRTKRQVARGTRVRNEVPTVAIVGYTNAGKSTLLNTLTNSEVLSENKLFATLDPTSRRLRFPEERELVLTDTVGFIRDLPKELREAFRATLEELEQADLLLHVIDVSDPAYSAHMRSTERILHELGHDDVPMIRVYNKADRLSEDERADRRANADGVFISALRRKDTTDLIDALDRWLVANQLGTKVGASWSYVPAPLPEAEGEPGPQNDELKPTEPAASETEVAGQVSTSDPPSAAGGDAEAAAVASESGEAQPVDDPVEPDKVGE